MAIEFASVFNSPLPWRVQVATIEGKALVFGPDKSLREDARKFTLKQRVADDPFGSGGFLRCYSCFDRFSTRLARYR